MKTGFDTHLYKTRARKEKKKREKSGICFEIDPFCFILLVSLCFFSLISPLLPFIYFCEMGIASDLSMCLRLNWWFDSQVIIETVYSMLCVLYFYYCCSLGCFILFLIYFNFLSTWIGFIAACEQFLLVQCKRWKHSCSNIAWFRLFFSFFIESSSELSCRVLIIIWTLAFDLCSQLHF